MHALGWWHEQQREDRDKHVKIWEDRCTWSKDAFNVNYQKMGGRLPWQDQGSPYDVASIMHYNTYTCKKGSDHVITKPDGSPLILKRTSSLSEQDAWQINQIYKCECQTCPTGWTAINIGSVKKCFKSKGKHASSKAHSICQSEYNSNLPLPLTPKEDDQYNAAFLKLEPTATKALLDLSDKDKEGTFVRLSNGKAPTWFNWAASEPNNLENEDYVVQYMKSSSTKTWNDLKSTSEANVFCSLDCPSKGEFYDHILFHIFFQLLPLNLQRLRQRHRLPLSPRPLRHRLLVNFRN